MNAIWTLAVRFRIRGGDLLFSYMLGRFRRTRGSEHRPRAGCRDPRPWGAVTVATALVRNTADLAIIRLLLGIAEAGFYPGIMYYLTLWFPQAFRVRFAAFFIASQPISFIIGGPLAALILEMDGYGGLHGWQWLFVIEGVPTVLLALRLPHASGRACG